jgi:pyrimidine-specific ribonucleoside hydrolase
MKRKVLITVGVILGVLVFLFILAWPAAPLLHKLGVPVYCIQGNWSDLQFVPCPGQTTASALPTPLPMPPLGAQGPTPIIIDDDGSPDGMIALLYFLRNPLFDVRAVTISCGEAHPNLFARHVQQLLFELGEAGIPVGAGRAAPLEGNNAFPDPWRQSSDEFWGIDLLQVAGLAEPVPAAQLIVDAVSGSGQPVTIFVSGTQTNLAEALRLEPGIAGNIRDVYIMGGSINVPGNIESDWPSIHNQVAEWNIWADPQAASEVFSSGLTLHLVPLDATRQVTWTRDDIPDWVSSGSAESARAGDLLKWMLDSWAPEGVFVWDLVAAIQATNPQICAEVPLAVEVITAPGEEQGRTSVVGGSPNISACLAPDAGQVKALAAYIFGQP